MAVQAQLRSEAFSTPDLEEQQLRMMPMTGYKQMSIGYQQRQSDLTPSNNSGSRKRNRDHNSNENDLLFSVNPMQNLLSHRQHLCGDLRSERSPMTSTSERSSSSTTTATTFLSSRDDLIKCFFNQNLAIDALLRLQNERLRSGLQEASKRHCRALFAAVDRQIQTRFAEKESELERAKWRSLELEQKLKQVALENQIWFNAARNAEGVVASLRTNLEQALLHQSNARIYRNVEEGVGESGSSDELSFCYDEVRRETAPPATAALGKEEVRSTRSCKVCSEGEVSVLLLPCRHLCLCKTCESSVDTCPVCLSTTNACINVFV